MWTLELLSGIRESMLLSESEIHLHEIPMITNELMKFKNLHSECTFKTFQRWLEDIYGGKWPQPESPTCQAFTKCIERLNARLVRIKKQRNCLEKDTVISEFLQRKVCSP